MKKIIMIILLLFSCISPVYAENIENSNSLTINLAEEGRIEKVFDDGSSIIIEDVNESMNTRAGLTVTGKKITGKSSCGRIQLSFYIDTKAYMANDDPENPIYYTKIKNYYGKAVTVYAGTFREDNFVIQNLTETANNPAKMCLSALVNANYENWVLQNKRVKLYVKVSNGNLTVNKEGF